MNWQPPAKPNGQITGKQPSSQHTHIHTDTHSLNISSFQWTNIRYILSPHYPHIHTHKYTHTHTHTHTQLKDLVPPKGQISGTYSHHTTDTYIRVHTHPSGQITVTLKPSHIIHCLPPAPSASRKKYTPPHYTHTHTGSTPHTS